METVVLILNDADLLPEVLRGWEDAGVHGVTVLRSIGLGHINNAMYRDDAPLFPSLREVLGQQELHHVTLLSVVESPLVDRLIEMTERITGPLDQPNTGMLFTLPVGRVVGGYRP